MEKLDLKKARKQLFTAPVNRFIEVQVPACRYLAVDGHGDPNTAPEYKHAVQGLYTTAYTLKAQLKPLGRDFVVSPLEGLWASANPEDFVTRRKEAWDWTLMIMVPDYVEQEHVDVAGDRARQKLGPASPAPRLQELKEGHCLQALHIGSYDDEAELLARLHGEVMPAGGYDFSGPHHEIYLSDPRRTAPSKLRTILRQPVRPAS